MIDEQRLAWGVAQRIAPHIACDDEFVSAEGRDSGYVQVWNLGNEYDPTLWLVVYGNNADTHHEFVEQDPSDHEDGLAVWLLPADDCDPLMWTCVVGSDELTPAEDAGCDGPCSVIRQGHFQYGGKFECLSETASGDYETSGAWADAAVFPNAGAARAAIEQHFPAWSTYLLAHGENGRPSYFIVPVAP